MFPHVSNYRSLFPMSLMTPLKALTIAAITITLIFKNLTIFWQGSDILPPSAAPVE